MEKEIRKILEEIGENPDREGLKNTPERVIRMYEEIFRGYDKKQSPELTTFPNDKDNIGYHGIIIDKGEFCSTCEHHMVPFFGDYFFGYIPENKIIGLSKIKRLIDWHSARLQIQERLTREIVEDFVGQMQPHGVILILKARHLCQEIRGVRKKKGEMITSEVY